MQKTIVFLVFLVFYMLTYCFSMECFLLLISRFSRFHRFGQLKNEMKRERTRWQNNYKIQKIRVKL